MSAGSDQSSSDKQKPLSAGDGFEMFVGAHEAQEEIPEVVGQEQQSGGEVGDLSVSATEAAKAPLVFDFVEDVFGVGALAIEVDDLPGVGSVFVETGDVGFELVLGVIPE